MAIYYHNIYVLDCIINICIYNWFKYITIIIIIYILKYNYFNFYMEIYFNLTYFIQYSYHKIYLIFIYRYVIIKSGQISSI